MSSGRRKRHHEEEEHENHERWLVTYADMVTLLMVLFIVMFAMSQVDQKKFLALKNGLAAGFANSESVLPGADSLLEEAGTQPIAPVAPQQTPTNLAGASNAAFQNRSDALDEVKKLHKVQDELVEALGQRGLADDVRTTVDDRGLVISLVSHHVVFRADEAVLTPRGERVVDALGPLLLALPEHLEISGHTNQVKVKPKNYATDWDLSAARAVTVLRRLNEHLGLPTRRLSVAAYGHTMPLVDPSQPGSQAVNKRVDIVVLSSSDEETRRLVAQLAAAETTGTGNEPGTDTEGDAADASGTPDEEGPTS